MITAEQLVAHAPHVPVILLSHAADHDADAEAAEAGIADFLLVPGLSAERLEHAIRYAVHHQRTLARLAMSEERHALALRARTTASGTGTCRRPRLLLRRWKAMLGYADGEVGDTRAEWLGRVHADDRAALSRRSTPTSPGRTSTSSSSTGSCTATARTAGCCARRRRARHPRPRHRVVGRQTDVTHRKEAERRLQHDAMHDALTGLPNRVLFLDRLGQAIRRARRHHPNRCAAVLFLDLDRFKVVNDSLGHQAGDELLKAVSRRLESALRPNDTVARLCGDEFTLLLDDVSDAREATRIAERVLATLKAPFELDGRELFVDASIGIAVATADSTPGGDARRRRRHVPGEGRREGPPRRLRRRDARAGHAPAGHGGRAAPRDRARRAGGRLPADRAGRDGPDRRLRGALPLARRQRRAVEPADFLGLAEETGLVVALGRWLLRQACAEAARWRQGRAAPA